MPRITPTVGRKLYLRNPDGGLNQAVEADGVTAQPIDATIVAVHDNKCINVAGNDALGHHFSRVGVTLFDGEGEPPTGMYCEWMPYQLGQAGRAQS